MNESGTTVTDPAASRQAEADERAVVEAAIACYRRTAFHEVTPERVAADSGIPLSVVRDAFPTWESLVEAVVDLWTARRMGAVFPIAAEAGAVAFLRAVVTANLADPDLMRMLSALVNVAATADHPLSGYLQLRWLHFYAFVQRAVAADVAAGREPASMNPVHGAEQLIALYEGLQIQVMVRPGMDVLDAFDRAIARFRTSWAVGDAVLTQVWEL